MKTIPAIAAEQMPYGTWVEVGEDGFARADPTLCCRGGVLKRPPGPKNDAELGERVKVQTHGPVRALVGGHAVPLELEEGHILGGAGAVQGRRLYP